jgi:hypothetical protein
METEKRGLDALTEREWELVDEMSSESISAFSLSSISIYSSGMLIRKLGTCSLVSSLAAWSDCTNRLSSPFT